jgi:hypothetical protein
MLVLWVLLQLLCRVSCGSPLADLLAFFVGGDFAWASLFLLNWSLARR